MSDHSDVTFDREQALLSATVFSVKSIKPMCLPWFSVRTVFSFIDDLCLFSPIALFSYSVHFPFCIILMCVITALSVWTLKQALSAFSCISKLGLFILADNGPERVTVVMKGRVKLKERTSCHRHISLEV